MSKRAQYNGAFLDGVVVNIAAPGEPDNLVHVPQGGLLPEDAPASVRDELLAREDWSERKSPSSPKKED